MVIRSFKGRLILTLYLVALMVAGAVCWVGAAIVEDEIELRLVHDTAANIGRVMGGMNLRPTTGVLQRLADIANGDVLIMDSQRHVVGGSLDTTDLRLSPSISELVPGQSDTLVLNEVRYVVGISEFSLQPTGERFKLLVLIPSQRLADVRRTTITRLIIWTLVVVAVATGFILIAGSKVTSALRNLTIELDSMSRRVTVDGVEGLNEVSLQLQGPEETMRLTEAFQRVIASLEGAEEKLAKLERLAAIGKVTASVVHEIRNPLSGIQMNLRLLQDETIDNPEITESLDIIGREVKRLDLYVDELVVLAKSGTPSPDDKALTAVSVAEELSYTCRLLEGKTVHAGVDIKQSVGDDIPDVVADPIRIRQVFMNLLINALEATPAGGRIAIEAHADAADVIVTFTDSGEGIPDDADDIFDAFVTTKAHGGGLGLYICRQIMDSFGGTISGSNTDDGGACFELKLRIYDHG